MADGDRIFGYDWADIQRSQQRGRLSRPIDLSKASDPVVSDTDRELLAKHGSIEALEAAGLFGVADRFRRAS